jgi:ABC-type transport system involved in cytochrome c biogenesis ATPase subunit
MIRLPTAKPIIVTVKGREVTDRLVSKFISRAGIIVITAHMPAFANTAIIRVMQSRNHE